MLMNAPAVYTAVTSSLHVQTPLDPTAVHVTSISMETVKTASTLQAVSSFHKFGLLVVSCKPKILQNATVTLVVFALAFVPFTHNSKKQSSQEKVS